MNRYILIVDIIEDGEEASHALYFQSTNGTTAQEYADLWMYKQYGDDPDDFELVTYELFLVRVVGSA